MIKQLNPNRTLQACFLTMCFGLYLPAQALSQSAIALLAQATVDPPTPVVNTGMPVVVQIVSSVLTFLSTCFLAWIGYLTIRLSTKQDDAAKEVNKVKETLAVSQETTISKFNGQDRKLDKIHGLVNSGMTAELSRSVTDKHLILELMRRAGDEVGVQVALASLKKAESVLSEHLSAQAKIDDREDELAKSTVALDTHAKEAAAKVVDSMANVDRVADKVEKAADTIVKKTEKLS